MKDLEGLPQLGLLLPAYREASMGYLGCMLEGPTGDETKKIVQKSLVASVLTIRDTMDFVGAADFADFYDHFLTVEPNWNGIDAAKAYRYGILINKALEVIVAAGITAADWDDAKRLAGEAEAELEAAGEMQDVRDRHDKCRCVSCRVIRGEDLSFENRPDF